MAKKIQEQMTEDIKSKVNRLLTEAMTEDIKSTVDNLLDEALRSANRDEGELAVFNLEKARTIASEIGYDISEKVNEIRTLKKSWSCSKTKIKKKGGSL